MFEYTENKFIVVRLYIFATIIYSFSGGTFIFYSWSDVYK